MPRKWNRRCSEVWRTTVTATMAIYVDQECQSLAHTKHMKWINSNMTLWKSSKDLRLVIACCRSTTEHGFSFYLYTCMWFKAFCHQYLAHVCWNSDRFSSFGYNNDKFLTFHMAYYETHFIFISFSIKNHIPMEIPNSAIDLFLNKTLKQWKQSVGCVVFSHIYISSDV